MLALIVDDSKATRMVLARSLKEVGIESREASNGVEALHRLNAGEQFELMLVDWNMPEMNGYQFVCAVRANVLLSDIRIMMVTTESSMGQVQSAIEAGANEYLMKPFSRDTLLEKLALLGFCG